MNQWYCKKCGVNSPGSICSRCGKKLPNNIMRDIWRVYRVPLSDTASWKTAFVVLLSASLIMLFFLFMWETAKDPGKALSLFSNGTAAACLALVPVGLLCQFILGTKRAACAPGRVSSARISRTRSPTAAGA